MDASLQKPEQVASAMSLVSANTHRGEGELYEVLAQLPQDQSVHQHRNGRQLPRELDMIRATLTHTVITLLT